MTVLKCNNCGAAVEMNSDLPVTFCPYCGQKTLIESKTIEKILTEKEKTKRTEAKISLASSFFDKVTENRDKSNEEALKIFPWVVLLMAIIAAMVIFGR